MWYIDRTGERKAAIVVAVDVTHPPPFYSVRLEGVENLRETEGHRLEVRHNEAAVLNSARMSHPPIYRDGL